MNQHRLAQTAFLVTLGGFFIYHSLAAFEVIAVPLPFGGWWSYANAATALALGLVFVSSQDFLKGSHLPFLALCFWVACIVVWHRAYGTEWQRLNYVFAENAKLLVGWSAFYLIGLYLRLTARFAIIVCILVACCTAAVPFLIQTDPFSPLDDDRRRFQGEVASYQFFANALVFMALAALASLKSIKAQAAIVIAVSIAVLLLGARSETIGLGLVAMLWILAIWFEGRTFPWKPVVVVASCGVLVAAAGVVGNAQVLQRYFEALDLSSSQSWQFRAGFLVDGLTDIKGSWFWGEYAGQMKSEPIGTLSEQNLAFGQYIHNALGAWRQFGLVPFALVVAMSGYALWKGWRLAFANRIRTPEARLLLYVAFYSVVLLVLTKSIYWPMPALAWGLAVNLAVKRDGEDRRLI